MAGRSDKKWDVLALGLACYDHLVKVPSFEQAAKGCGTGEVSVQGGGVAATAAAAVAVLGGKVRFHTRVADDFFGRFIVEGLQSIGVDTQAAVVNGGHSPVCTVLVDDEGERRFIYHPGRNLELAEYAVSEEETASSKCVLIDGRWPEASLDLAAKALRYNVPIVVDIGHGRPHEKELLKTADYPVLSSVMLGRRAHDAEYRKQFAREVIENGRARFVVITLGADGVEVFDKDAGGVSVRAVPSYSGHIVDTCGAGDTLHGAFAYAVSQEWDRERVVDVAQAAGTLACRKLGGRAALPTMAEVETLIAGGRQG
ncbi:MAG: carbohydrate kinase family protein [Planctomycetes bacterium]|nr:carbohydrate kinase family protein [Planctomycetota bacterium]